MAKIVISQIQTKNIYLFSISSIISKYISCKIVCNKIFITLSVFEVNITSLRWYDDSVDYKYVVNKVYKVRNIELSIREIMVVRRR